MTEEIKNPEVQDNDPVFYNPKTLNLVATFANIMSWLFLVSVALGLFFSIRDLQTIMEQQGFSLQTLMAEAAFWPYAFTNIISPLLSGLGWFAVMQGLHIGLNAVQEVEFNQREAK